jgi:AraC-like DNA-binding protein
VNSGLPDLQLAPRYTRVATGEVAAASAVIEDLQGPFQLRDRGRDAAANEGGAGDVRIRAARCGSIAVSTFTFGRAVDIIPSGMEGALLVTTAIHGSAAIASGGGVFHAGAGETLLAQDEDAPTFIYAPDTEVLKLRFDRRRLEQMAAQVAGRDTAAPLHFDTAMTAPGAAPRWLALLRYLLVALNGAARMSKQELASIEEHLMLTLLNIQPHNHHAQPATRPSLAARQFRAATEFIARNAERALTLDDIAAAAHCSIRTLARVFAAAGEVAPVRYVQRLRLGRVRAALSNAGAPERTIAEIAYEGGFQHLGEFNRQYRQLFGETPSVTRRTSLAGIRLPAGKNT